MQANSCLYRRRCGLNAGYAQAIEEDAWSAGQTLDRRHTTGDPDGPDFAFQNGCGNKVTAHLRRGETQCNYERAK